MTAAFIDQCDAYLGERSGSYEYRAVRYTAAGAALASMGLEDSHTVYDIGAGWTEFDYTMRTVFNWKGRYIPIDGGIDGIDLDYWTPPRKAEYFVALELLEHLNAPDRLIRRMQNHARKGIVVSVPNPRTVDVLGIDSTHKTIVTRDLLEAWGFQVTERTFYGGVWSKGEHDSLFGVWQR